MSEAVTRTSGGRGSTVPPAEVRSYYGQPIIKPPVWTWEIPVYFFAGGLAGASSVLAAVAGLTGNRRLARTARLAAGVGAAVSPPLLISDLGKPSRFYNMLRVLRPTSPMSVGSWLLGAYAPAALGAAGLEVLDRLPRLRALAGAGAAALGPGLATYTAVLVADTAVPVWHEARRHLPAVFAASATASAGAAAVLVDPDDPTSRAATLIGAAVEIGVVEAMEQHLGELAQPYEEGLPGRWSTVARWAGGVGAAMVALTGRRGRRVGAVLVLLGAGAQRAAVFTAGFVSAADPSATAGPQRRRLQARQQDVGDPGVPDVPAQPTIG